MEGVLATLTPWQRLLVPPASDSPPYTDTSLLQRMCTTHLRQPWPCCRSDSHLLAESSLQGHTLPPSDIRALP